MAARARRRNGPCLSTSLAQRVGGRNGCLASPGFLRREIVGEVRNQSDYFAPAAQFAGEEMPKERVNVCARFVRRRVKLCRSQALVGRAVWRSCTISRINIDELGARQIRSRQTSQITRTSRAPRTRRSRWPAQTYATRRLSRSSQVAHATTVRPSSLWNQGPNSVFRVDAGRSANADVLYRQRGWRGRSMSSPLWRRICRLICFLARRITERVSRFGAPAPPCLRPKIPPPARSHRLYPYRTAIDLLALIIRRVDEQPASPVRHLVRCREGA